MEEIVLSHLKRVSDFVIGQEGDFVDIALRHARFFSGRSYKKARQASEAENSIKALNKIIPSLYEEKVMGRITKVGDKRTVTICLPHIKEIDLP